MKKNKLQILAWVFAWMPLLLIAVFYQHLPDNVPMQWQGDGNIEYGNKISLWLMGALSPVLMILLQVTPRIDPMRRNYQKFHDSYALFQLVITLFLLIMTGIVLTESLRPNTVNVAMVACICCGLLFAVFGNMMPKTRPNWFFGIRTPWTISNETIWLRTHRLGGRIMFGSGLIIIAAAFIPNDYVRMAAIFLAAFATSIIPIALSWWWYHQTEQH